MGDLNTIADVSSIEFNVRTASRPHIDAADFFSGIKVNHLEKMGRHFMYGMRRNPNEFHDKLFVLHRRIAAVLVEHR